MKMTMTEKNKAFDPRKKRTALRVLIVEGNPLDAKLIQVLLEKAGYHLIFERIDLLDVLEKRLQESNYDVIISDYNLGSWTAIDGLAKIQNSGNDIPLIVVTGTLGDEAAAACIKQGAADFILKDRMARLPDAVERVIGEKKARDEHKRAAEEIIRLNRVYAAISQINQLIVRVKDRDRLFSDACRIVIEHGKFLMAWVGKVDHEEQTVKPIAWSGIENDYWANISGISLEDAHQSHGPTATSLRRRKYFVCNDIASDPGMAAWRDEALKRGYGSSIALPIIVQGKPYAIFNIYAGEPCFFNKVEADLLEEVTANISFALDAIEADELRKGHEEQIQILSRFPDENPSPVLRVSPEGIIQYANPASEPLLTAWNTATGKTLPDDFRMEVTGTFRSGRSNEIEFECSDQVYSFILNPLIQAGYVNVYGRNITERKRSEEALRESEDRHRDLVEYSRDLICTHDLEGRLLSVNAEPARVLGYTTDELLKTNMRDLLAPEVRDKFKDYLRQIQKDGAASGTLLVRTRTGERRIWEYNNTLRTEGLAQPIVRGMAHDVTQRREALKALRESEERFRSLVENATVGIYRTTPAGQILMGNLALAKMLGYESFEEMAAGNLKATGFEPSYPRNEFRTRLERDGEVKGLEAAWTRRDGRNIFVLESGRVVRDARGHVLYYDGIVEDITERKRAEDATVKLKKAVDSSGEVIFMADREGIITFVNPEFSRLYGYSAAEVVGKVTPRILKSGKVSPEEYESFWKTILSGTVVKTNFVNRTKVGTLVNIEASVNPILDERGEITGFLAIQRNVTDHVALETQFRQAQKMEAVGQLAGGVAHDFNNLLTVINGYSEVMLGRLKADEPFYKYATEIKKAGERAAGLTRQLLAFSRQQILAPQVLDLNKVIAGVHSILRRIIGEDIELVILPGDGLGMVRADPGQFEQVLLNLAVNARDAMPQGGKLTIETSNADLGEDYALAHGIGTPGPTVMVAMSDTGAGMDAGTQKHIFEPFFTTKEKGKGTGLGLSTVYGIVQQSAGHILCYSEVARGTTFKIYLPRVEEKKGAVERMKAHARPSEGTETILLVEDDAAIRKLAGEVLKAKGYEVLIAQDGAEAQVSARDHKGLIHILVTDLVMPGISGRVLSERLEALYPKMKVLFMSGYTDDAVVRHGGLKPGIAFLQKPFTPEGLAGKVRDTLDGGLVEDPR
jgi:PAS domain S-box-containing protein